MVHKVFESSTSYIKRVCFIINKLMHEFLRRNFTSNVEILVFLVLSHQKNWYKREKNLTVFFPSFFAFSFFFFFLLRVLRDNPLVCSCDHYWLQQWQRNDRGDLDNQMLSCFSDNEEIPLNSLVLDNCSEFDFRFDISHILLLGMHIYCKM